MNTKDLINLTETISNLSFEDKGKYIVILSLIKQNKNLESDIISAIGSLSESLKCYFNIIDGFICLKQAKKQMNKETYSFIKEAIEYLNIKTKRNNRLDNKQSIKLLSGLKEQGYTIEQVKTAIDNKCLSWMDTAQEIYLRPITLFGNKFDGYLNERRIVKINNNNRYMPYGEISNRV